MRKYLECFINGFDSTITEKVKPENGPYVGYDMVSDEIVFTIVPTSVVYDPYVTFTAEEDNSSIGLTQLSTNQTLEYSADTTTWNTFDTETNISLNNGDKVYIRGILSADNTYASDYTQFKMTGKIAASGNCNAIWNYQDLEAPLKAYCGYSMFCNCSSLTTAPELPATTLADYCYSQMFYNCTSLTKAPELPATTLADGCYYDMFSGCTSLTTAPELPATTLADNCYISMFKGCTSLATAPELPATTLVTGCYASMFNSCSSLTTAPELPATTLAKKCYASMFNGCSSLTTAPELPATTLANNCYENMFNGCTSLATAPKILPATKLTPYCYRYMFLGCTSLLIAPELPATKLNTPCCYNQMFYGCSNLNYIKCLATVKISNSVTSWVNGVSSTGTFIKHPDMSKWTTGTSGIPSGWTVVDAVL